MIEAPVLAAWTAQVTRLILRHMSTYGVPTTRDERWAMARRLYPTVEQLRREAYARSSAQLRAEGFRPAPMAPYRPSALVAVIERATDAEPYVRPGRRDEVPLERVEPQPRRVVDSEPSTEPAPERPERNRTAERRARVRVSAPAQQPRARAQVRVAANDLDPRSRAAARRRVVVTDQNRRDPVVVRTVTERVSATVERHIRQVDRETTVATANTASDEIGWARVLSGAENCAFCAMLASRGPVYRSDKSALTVVGGRRGARGTRSLGERYHDFCDCDCVLVRAGEDWAGREEFERLQRMWTAASAAHPEDAQRAFNRSWRRIQRHPELEEEYDRLWADSTTGLEGSAALRAFAAVAAENPPAALDARRRSSATQGSSPATPTDPAEDPTPPETEGETPPPEPPQDDNGEAATAEDPFDGLPFPNEYNMLGQDNSQLTDAERRALWSYAQGGHRRVNEGRRGNQDIPDNVAEHIDDIRSAMDRFVLQRDYRVTRSVEATDLGITSSDQVVDLVSRDAVLTDPAFLSTSGLRVPPFIRNRRDPVVLDIIVPEGTNAILMDETLSPVWEHEHELLLPENTPLQVLDARYDDDLQVWRLSAMVLPEAR